MPSKGAGGPSRLPEPPARENRNRKPGTDGRFQAIGADTARFQSGKVAGFASDRKGGLKMAKWRKRDSLGKALAREGKGIVKGVAREIFSIATLGPALEGVLGFFFTPSMST